MTDFEYRKLLIVQASLTLLFILGAALCATRALVLFDGGGLGWLLSQ